MNKSRYKCSYIYLYQLCYYICIPKYILRSSFQPRPNIWSRDRKHHLDPSSNFDLLPYHLNLLRILHNTTNTINRHYLCALRSLLSMHKISREWRERIHTKWQCHWLVEILFQNNFKIQWDSIKKWRSMQRTGRDWISLPIQTQYEVAFSDHCCCCWPKIFYFRASRMFKKLNLQQKKLQNFLIALDTAAIHR